MWSEGRGGSRGQARGVAYVVCPPPWWCCVQGSCAVPCFCSQHPVFVGLLVFLYLVVHNLPQLHMHSDTFSPLWFLCIDILLLEEMFVHVQALQQRLLGPSLSFSPLRDSTPLFLRGKGLKVSSETSSCWTGATDLS